MPSPRWTNVTVPLDSGRQINLNVLVCGPERDVGLDFFYWDDWVLSRPLDLTSAEAKEIDDKLTEWNWREELSL